MGLLRSGGAEKLWGKTGSKTGQKTVGRSIRGTVGSSGEGGTRLGSIRQATAAPDAILVSILEGENMSLRVENIPNVTIFTHHRIRHGLVM